MFVLLSHQSQVTLGVMHHGYRQFVPYIHMLRYSNAHIKSKGPLCQFIMRRDFKPLYRILEHEV
jgi:hypothetical protein